MQNVKIPINISPEIMIALNENEQNLKSYFQTAIAVVLFQDGKLTIGKAIQLSGLSRYEFEKELVKKNIPISNPSITEVFSDMQKLSDL